MLKRSISAFLAMALTAGSLLTGCSGGSSSAPAASKASSPSAQSGDSTQPAAGAVTFKLATGTSQSYKEMCAEFKKAVEAETKGQIVINVFADNSLGGEREVVEGAQIGDVDLATSSTSPLASFYSNLYLFDTPYLFESRDEAYQVEDGEVGNSIAKGLEDKGLKCLGFAENGWRDITTSDREIHTPDDLKGLKIRVMENEIQIAIWKALGSNPTPMSFTEVFTALQQKTIDGQENPVEVIYSSKLNEVQKYLILSQHIYNPYIFVMNKEKFDALSADNQKIILDTAKKVIADQRQAAVKYEQEEIDKMKAAGNTTVIALTDAEKQQFRDKVSSVYDLVKGKMANPELMDQVKSTLGR